MGCIKILDQNMINMIAAGEVIERPASVVKELIENSLDAGAAKITVTIEDGGRKLIAVTDNGSGMDADDLEKAFQPHATSKVSNSGDLAKISTMGFRGEALASIASVSQLRAVSRTRDAAGANSLSIDCGEKTAVAPASADYGTTIEVRDLFYKLPARRKFLKTAATEMTHVTECFKRIALANCKIDFKLIHNGRQVYNFSADDGLLNRIRGFFGDEMADNLIETAQQEKGVTVHAFLGKPAIAKTNSNFQYIFLNGRYIRDKFISHAVKEAYRGQLEPCKFPVVFLFMEMPPDDFDVNVHPTKIEVRFFNSNLIHSQILSVIRQKLLSTNMDMPVALDQRAGERKEKIKEAMEDFFKSHRPAAASQRNFSFGGSAKSFTKQYQPVEFSPNVTIPLPESSADTEKKFVQIHDSFIVAQSSEGFVIIDQHALHERIMYENLKKRIENSPLESQMLLVPETFEVTETQADTIENNSALFEKLGIALDSFGPKVIAVHSFPLLLTKTGAAEFVTDMLDLLANKSGQTNKEELLDEVLHMAACKAAIKAGQKLTDEEIEHLLKEKGKTEYSSRCPHGRPTTITFSLAELEKQFKRT